MFLNLRHLYIICSAIKDGYESDGALVFKRRESQNTPRSQTPAEAKTAYNQIQKGILKYVFLLRIGFCQYIHTYLKKININCNLSFTQIQKLFVFMSKLYCYTSYY